MHYDTNYIHEVLGDQNLEINVNHRGERSKSDLQLARTFRWLYSTDLYIEVEPFRARIIFAEVYKDRKHVKQVDITLTDADWVDGDNLSDDAVEVIMDLFLDPFYEVTPHDSHDTIDVVEEAFRARVDWEDFKLRKEDEKLLEEEGVIENETLYCDGYGIIDLAKEEAIHLIKELKLFRANQQIRVKRSAIENMFLD